MQILFPTAVPTGNLPDLSPVTTIVPRLVGHRQWNGDAVDPATPGELQLQELRW
jgi:hypothetical protein